MLQFIEKDEFHYSDGQINLLKSNRVVYELELEKLNTKLSRATKLISEVIDLSEENSLVHIEIARQKVRAIKAAIQQLEGVN